MRCFCLFFGGEGEDAKVKIDDSIKEEDVLSIWDSSS